MAWVVVAYNLAVFEWIRLQSPRWTIPQVLLLSLAVLIAFGPTARWLVRAWQIDPYYSHGWLVLLVALFFCWRAVRRAPATSGTYAGLIPLVPALLVHLAALPYHAFYLSALMIVPVVLGLALLLRGWAAFRALAVPAGFLALIVPLPFIPSLSPPLEALAASAGAGLARLAGLPVQQTGAAISLPGQSFVVGAACSGLYSLMALVTLTAVFLYLVDGHLGNRLLLIAIAPFIALAANILRIAILLGVANTWGTDLAMGFYHTYSSPFLFLLATGALIGSARVLRCSSLRHDI